MKELSAKLDVAGLSQLRYVARHTQETAVDIGYVCLVGDKLIRIFPSNRVEISEIEYLDREEDGEGEVKVQYVERPSWVTQFPESLSIEDVKASLDYAYLHAGLPSLFFMTNLSMARFESRDEEKLASLMAFKVLYPQSEPWISELNATLEQFAEDQRSFGLSD